MSNFLLALSIFSMGAALCIFPVIGYVNGLRTTSWKAINGTILKSSTTDYPTSGYTGTTRRSYSSVVYQYDIGGTIHKSSFISYKSLSSIVIKGRYLPGFPTTVYVNPQDPGQSVLVKGEDPFWLRAGFIVGAIFALMGIAVFLFNRGEDDSA